RDQVRLSSALREQWRRLKPPPRYPPDPRPRAAAPRPPAPEPEEPDLFADLRPNAAGVLPPRQARAAPDAPPSATPPVPPAPAPSALQKPAPPAATARQAADQPPDEAAALLRLTEEALQREDVRAAHASLGEYLALHREVPHRVPWRARLAQSRLDILEGNTVAALEAFEAMLKSGYDLREEQAPALVEGLLQGAPEALRDTLRVSLLLKVLAVFRQANQREAMDRLYPHLAAAQEKVGDDRKLVQLLKNHLEIKRVLGETSGQPELIDQIGNRLFKLGDTEQAKEYYAMSLKLRGEQQEALASAGGGPTKSAS
ncbi:MAG TPA: hypothetical protein VL359_08025, partial [bacterium]|nr:hypothetical protein [bacterium]